MILLFVCLLISYSNCAQAPFACNGYPELCDRRLNQIAWIVAHDATANKFSLVNDQERSIIEQLNDGVRGFKMPLHYDYANPLGYYSDLLDWYLKVVLEKHIANRKAIVNQVQQQGKSKIDDALDKVKSLQNQIDAVDKKMSDETTWYKKLPKFSLTHKSQTSESFEYGGKMAGWEAEKLGLQGSLKTAEGVLKLARESTKIIDPKLDPELKALEIEKTLISDLKKELIGQSYNVNKQDVFCCHGLSKSELYRDWGAKLFDALPAKIRNKTQNIEPKISKAISNLREELFGEKKDIGGLLPYTPCSLDAGKVSLTDFLKIIVGWMKQHPHEVIILYFENYVNDYTQLTHIFQNAGAYQYLLAQPYDKPWPTLREMVTTGKRLVVFMQNNHPGNNYPWFLYRDSFAPWSMRYQYDTVADITDTFDPTKEYESNRDTKGYGPNNNWMFNVSHTVTAGLSGTKNAARKINKQSVVEWRMNKYMQTSQHIVNGIGVDFYNLPCGKKNEAHCTRADMEIFKALDHINGVGAYKGDPLYKDPTINY